jgi:hypothetical protein
MTDAPTETLPTVAGADQTRAVAAGSCRDCSAPLAADQRYCLSCGMRVAAPRVDWASTLGGAGGAAAQPAAGGARAGGRWALMLDRVGGPMGAAAVVLVALGVGFLLGQGDSGPSGPATIIQRPPVVNVQGGGSAPAADAGSTSTDAAGSSGASRDHARGGGGSTAGIPRADTNDSAGGDLNRLRAQPDEQATGGEPPRRDNRASGGGSDTETIG